MQTITPAFLLMTAIAMSDTIEGGQPNKIQQEGLRVFVIAHSFHIFVADRLALLAKAAGLQLHEPVGRQMIGGG